MCTDIGKLAQVDFRRMSRARKGPIRVIQVAIGGDHIILLAHCCGEATVFAAGMQTYTCSRMGTSISLYNCLACILNREHMTQRLKDMAILKETLLDDVFTPMWRQYLSLWTVMAHVSGPAQSIDFCLCWGMQIWNHAIASALLSCSHFRQML